MTDSVEALTEELAYTRGYEAAEARYAPALIWILGKTENGGYRIPQAYRDTLIMMAGIAYAEAAGG